MKETMKRILSSMLLILVAGIQSYAQDVVVRGHSNCSGGFGVLGFILFIAILIGLGKLIAYGIKQYKKMKLRKLYETKQNLPTVKQILDGKKLPEEKKVRKNKTMLKRLLDSIIKIGLIILSVKIFLVLFDRIPSIIYNLLQ